MTGWIGVTSLLNHIGTDHIPYHTTTCRNNNVVSISTNQVPAFASRGLSSSLFDHVVVPPSRAELARILAVQVTIPVHRKCGEGHKSIFGNQNRIFAALAATSWQVCVVFGETTIQRDRGEKPQGCQEAMVSGQLL